jgi:hypothetical protein
MANDDLASGTRSPLKGVPAAYNGIAPHPIEGGSPLGSLVIVIDVLLFLLPLFVVALR